MDGILDTFEVLPGGGVRLEFTLPPVQESEIECLTGLEPRVVVELTRAQLAGIAEAAAS